MRYLRKWQLAAVCLLALALLPFVPASRGTAQATGYTVIDLGALGTGDVSGAFGLNECGKVVGESTLTASNDDDTHPFIWNDANGNGVSDPGEMKDLGTLGGITGKAVAVNQNGTVVGTAHTSGNALHGFIWKDLNGNGQRDTNVGGLDEMQDLGTLGGITVDASDVNDSEKVVGQSEQAASGSLQERAFVWEDSNGNGKSDPDEMKALAAPSWGTPLRAFGINNSGQVAGVASVNGGGGFHGYVTVNSVAVDIGTLNGSTVSFVNKINGQGEVAGYSYTSASAQTFHAIRWKDLNGNGQRDTNVGGVDEMQDLGTLGTGRNSLANDLNGNGLVVGKSETVSNSSSTHAFVWQDANNNGQSDPGEMQDLNVLAPGTSWTFQDAQGINARGQIVGVGINPDGKVHAFLLTPTNDPGPPAACSATPTPTPSPGTLQFSAATYTVGESGGSVVISVSRDGGSDGAVSVNYATSNGTATAGSDYAAANGTLNFAAGETTKTFGVTITDDTLDESDETVNLTLSNPTGGATLGAQSTATLSITDDDAQPTLQFSSATYSVAEGGGTAAITVTRSGGTNGAISVNYATSNGTATAGSDYTAASGTLTFAENETSKSFNISITNDVFDEPDETVNLTLSSPGGGAALGAQTTATLTITDDDTTPTFSISDATVIEGNTGTSPATTAFFTVTLTGVSSQTVTVNYATSDGTATQPSDYTSKTGTVTFNPNETGTKSITVAVIGDTADEAGETFNVTLSGAVNANISDDTAVGTITDDDEPPTVSVNDVVVTEGNAGTTNAAFSVTLSAASEKTVTVGYATSDGTATAGSDYTAVGSTQLTFNPGETSKPVNVSVLGDTTDEPNETFNVTLSPPANATINDGTGVGTIIDDDGAPSLSISDAAVTEGNSGDAVAVFTVTLSPASGQTVSVNFESADGTANAGPDYGGTAGTLFFAPGETTKTITVSAFGDTLNEPNETFFVNLSNATNAAIADAQGQGTINNDDTPTLRFSQAAYPVGESAHFVTVTVTRTGDASPAVGVSFATSDGTANERRDYTAVSGRLRFAAGETSKTFDVLLTEDAYTESEETVNLTLSNPTGGAALGSPATATVNLADTPPIAPNPIDVSSNFVRQHYHDFLGREPDAPGLAHWTDQMTNCGNPNLEICRINVSAAFFQAIEFQQTGYLVYRTYKAAYGDTTSPGVPGTVPIIRLQEFMPDTRIIGDGVIVGPPGWEDRLDANKNAYMQEFVQRPRFTAAGAFPLSMTAAQFVDKLNLNAGGVLTQAERDQLVAQLSSNPSGTAARASVLRAVAENQQLRDNEFRRAFVLMQYYGYLRRNPDDAPERDLNFGGWKFWLDKLNDFNGDFVQAQMVKAFLDSIEYRTRFAP